mgnify:CR=1 FL=1|jgi:hypothetical protein
MNPFVIPISCSLFIFLRFLFHHDLIISLWILVWAIDAIIIGLGLISVIQLIIILRKKRNRFAAICLAALLAIGCISYGTDLIKDLGLKLRFYRFKSAYSEIVENVKSETGPQKGNHLGIDYRSEIDPVFRVIFPWAGIVDNWYGIIYDPSGKVLRCNESDPRFPGPGSKAPKDTELSQIRMVFGGLLYKAEHLGNHWYLCWFT